MNQPLPQDVLKQKLTFRNASGTQLAALLERPAGEALGHALFAHCFTCSKDVVAASRISRAMAGRGFAVTRFDFTGLGNSEGDFANTNFSSNVQDLVAAADHLRGHLQAPGVLIGHSLGGAAVLAAANRIPEARAVVTIGAPSDPAHVRHLLGDSVAKIAANGRATVNLAGRQFEITRQFLEDISHQSLTECIQSMRKALLIFHSPVDDTVPIDNATEIFRAARHPKSFVSLDGADHLLSRKADSEFVAATIAAWAGRYAGTPAPAAATHGVAPDDSDVGDWDVLVRELDGRFAQQVLTDRHRMISDEPTEFGGTASGPSPYDYLLAGLGACTAMTVRMYATRKSLPLRRVTVKLKHDKIHAEDCLQCETKTGRIDRIEREIALEGDLSEEQRASVMAIADKCPVHRTLHSEVEILTRQA